MSKRKGDVVFLDDFIDEVGVDFARWFLVDRGHDQTIEIDVDLATEKSRKNPVYYVQYVHARTGGIFREAPDDAEVDPAPRLPLGGRGARARQAARRVPGGRARGDRAAGPARDPGVRDPARGRLPPLLRQAPRAGGEGRRARVVSARPRRGHSRRRRPVARSRRASKRRSTCDACERIEKPTVVASAGTLPKTIEEFVGRVNTGDAGVSIARMRSPQGWVEPAQTPEFDEYTLVPQRPPRRRARRRAARGAGGRGRPHAAG